MGSTAVTDCVAHAHLISIDAQRRVASCTLRRLSAWLRVCDMSGFPAGLWFTLVVCASDMV